MKVEKNKVVSISYKLNENDINGAELDNADENNPLNFIFGIGQLIPGFEKNILNKTAGDSFEFKVLPEEAYGDYDENAIVDLPIDIFMKDGKVDNEILKVGNIIPLQDNEGHVFQGKILKIGLEKVQVDFNHPLAGITLFFSGKILNVRPASDEELAHRHVHKH
ncbi:MAG: peptidylprolyl isomerase [Bacteroidales bacterium]|nr:peptidylprolyl isomerase [Bacteroidales bacterium]